MESLSAEPYESTESLSAELYESTESLSAEPYESTESDSTHTKRVLSLTQISTRNWNQLQRWDFWTVHGPEELSRINSSPARAAGEVAGKT